MREFFVDVKQTAILSIVMGVVITLINIFLIAVPLWNTYQEKSQKFNNIARRLAQSRAKVKDEELLIYIKKLKDKISEIEDRIVSDMDLPFVMEDIASVARESGLELRQILPKKSVPIKTKSLSGLEFCRILFIGVGGYHDVGRFVANLENSKYICKIDSITIIPNPGDYRHNDVKVMISVLSRKE